MGEVLSSALLLGGAISLLFSKRGALMDLSKSLLLLKQQDEGMFCYFGPSC